jgi:hypothetical protein
VKRGDVSKSAGGKGGHDSNRELGYLN